MSNTHKALLVGGLVILALAGWFLFRTESTYVEADMTVEGDYEIKSSERLVLKNGSKLTVNGNFTQNGELACENGELRLEVKGNTTINGDINCERTGDNEVSGIRVVAAGNLNLSSSSNISTNRSVQFASREDLMATTPEKIREFYDQAGKDEGAGQRLGPLVPAEGTAVMPKTSQALANNNILRVPFVAVAQAQAAPVLISGKISVATPPKGVRQIVLFIFPDASGVRLQDFELEGPDAADGESDVDASCNATGKDGNDAMRFMAQAANMSINNFTLKLGKGGNGGDASTKTDCDNAIAVGGKGGNSGNFKMVSAGQFTIEGGFVVVPGSSGSGGDAKAFGKNGEKPGDKGGDATATGGRASDNKKSFRIGGTVGGVDQIQFASIYGGRGGDAEAKPGRGGDGQGCGSNGGNGGKATATAGKGGDASLTAAGGTRTPDAEDLGGNGGNATSEGGNGGHGGDCGPEAAGGNGGTGGDAVTTKGSAGTGNPAGNEGVVNNEKGGNGGDGGDGCGPGNVGKGGNGNPKGDDGRPGANKCAPKKIQVIEYLGKYLPVAQLKVESEQGCDGGQPHWHAVAGVVTATDGSKVSDPGPQCGYGKVSDKPTFDLEVKFDLKIQ